MRLYGLCFASLAGCGWWVTAEEHLARVDADLDGVPADRDCDDRDATATTVGPVFADADGDGVGGADRSETCGVPAGFVLESGDCDDGDGAVSATGPAYVDEDGDGFGTGPSIDMCGVPSGFSADPGDCDDAAPLAFPGSPERCNGEDDDCNGTPDDGDPEPVPWFADHDADGWGVDGTEVVTCAPPDATVDRGGDCDDGDAGIHPAAAETCSGVDDDCDGLVDADDPGMAGTAVWYPDGDGDGWGDVSAAGVASCTAPSADAVQGLGDCADADAQRSPGATEICNTLDDDCDGALDAEDPDLDAPVYYEDDDGDGFGDLSRPVEACEAPSGYVDDATDCDDDDDGIFPAQTEVTLATSAACTDTVDNDCDGDTDGADADCRDDDVDGAYNGLDPVVAVDGDGDGDREALCVIADRVVDPEWAALDAYRAFPTNDFLDPRTSVLYAADLDLLGAILPGAWCWDLTSEDPGTYVYRVISAGSASDPEIPVSRTDCDTWLAPDLGAYCDAYDDPFCHTAAVAACLDDALFGSPGALRVVWNGTSL